ncbi:cellulase family glycosylhydrolase [Flavobacterium sp. Fl-77]|uniref:Cellulase family glycosylhydrolase n=1 Tax=Flavobacterium flavipigmentatum TaxID=2893884 RepID=A0AAJ2SFW2_9FLAO|nr:MULTISPECIES: cellulase family glycosylhydrolase [unclassified Flavobacterium]MDX6183466.1 cellulase family glycosylhydrolase [Flavobacterium sp. Fl-33]MDX6187132.1 cellulase family glycosylhydrolase [Flavobacterium sp. Fl-77]UFH40138.1 cellulase family glycosylhydrolase [Flavobacterium sp. F-70]
MKKLIFILQLLISIASFAQGFLHRDGQNIVDGNGKNVVLRGLGLGGWMVQEGYMLQTQSFASPQYVIRQKIQDVIGEEGTKEFYTAYKANGITKRDIDSLAVWGFNSVRLPMHYNLYTPPVEAEKNGQITWLEEGFTMTDNLLKWCAENKMYLILDLHAAPGGQGNDAAISDYDTTKPSLWESEANQKKMIALWKKLASRYKNNPWIGGYDIINEPNWNFTGTNKNGCDENANGPLRELMIAVTKAIREVDTNHLIFIEGNCWGNNYNGIFPLWDENMALSFHKYWNYNTTGSIQKMLDYRKQYNVPIWLGESGENSNVWFKEAISLVENNNIGWAFWPMKKIENIAGVTSVTKIPEYDVLLKYWKEGGTKPSVDFAKKALLKMADNYKMENLTVKPDVIDAMFRQVQSNDTKAYKKHFIPGKIAATEYDLGTNEMAYSDKDFVNYRVETGNFEEWNKGNTMRNDGVDILPCKDSGSNGYQVSFIEDGEWLQFTTEVSKTQTYKVAIRYSSAKSKGQIYLETEKGKRSKSITLRATGSDTNWKTITLSGLQLNAGINKIKIVFEKGGFNLNCLDFKTQK